LALMAQDLPSTDLGVMYGTMQQPVEMPVENIVSDEQKAAWAAKFKSVSKKEAEKKIKAQNQAANKAISLQEESAKVSLIQQVHSFEEMRTKELKYLLELSEHNPDILTDYIKIELGEYVEPKSNNKDTQLKEYLSELTSVRTKLKTLKSGDYQYDH